MSNQKPNNPFGSTVNPGLMGQIMLAGKLLFDGRVPLSLKLILPVAALLYTISPLDLMPGLPFDDIAVLFIALQMFLSLAAPSVNRSANDPSATDHSARTNDGEVVDTTWRVVD